jgi:hypothetical protein
LTGRTDYRQRATNLSRPAVGSAKLRRKPHQCDSAGRDLFGDDLCDGTLKAGLVFRRRTLELIQERPVDLLDIDAAVLHGLDGVGQFYQLAGGGVGVGETAGIDD